MTNQTNLDFLFQMTMMSERTTSSATASNGHRSEFDDHLLQASSTSGSRNNSELRSNSTDTTRQEQNRSINDTDERQSDVTASVSTAKGRGDDEAIDDQSEANEISPDTPVKAAGGDTDEGGDGDISTADESDEVVIAASIADGEAIRQSQTAAIVGATSSSDQANASEEIASTETQGDHQVAGENGNDKGENGLPNQLSLAASRSVRIDSSADHSSAPMEFVDVGVKDITAKSIDLAASETGKPASRKEKEKSNSRQPHASSATTANGISQKTEDSAIRRTASSKDAPANFNPAAADLNQAEEKLRHSSDDRIERRGEAAASNYRGPVPEVVAAQGAQLTSTTVNADATSDSHRTTLKPVGAAGEPLHTAVGRAQRGGKGAQRLAAGHADELPRVDAARFVGRVAKAVQVAHERGGSLQLRLSPPELGSLRLELTVQNGVMTASLETETPAARLVLLDHLPALRDRLAEQNIRVERFDVDVRHEQQSGGSDPRASQQQERQHQPSQGQPRHSTLRTSGPEEITHDVVAVRQHATNTSINVLA